MSTVLGLVVARGGSKGIPGKNLRLVAGQPLIGYTFRAARHSRALSRVVLSTDSAEIANAGRQYGVEVPFLRPPELARDDSPVVDAALHALTWLEQNADFCPDYIMLLQPTSPLRTAEDIDAAIRLAVERHADAVVSVTPADHHPFLMKVVDENGRMRPFLQTDSAERRRQDLPDVYAPNGALYLVRRQILTEKRSWCPEGTLAYIMPPERSLDVDTLWDLRLAEVILGGAA
jgi:CMP-N-acetylneuraminic acid synthetase